MAKHHLPPRSARLVIFLSGPDVVHVFSDGVEIECVIAQLDSGETDAAGRPVVSMQRGGATVDRTAVAQMYAVSDRIPVIPNDEEESHRHFIDTMQALIHGRNRNN